MNHMTGGDFRPFFDSEESGYRFLTNGVPYSPDDLDRWLFSGEAGIFHISTRYSDEIKALVRRCLRYNPHDRITVEALRNSIQAAKQGRADRGDDQNAPRARLLYPNNGNGYRMGATYHPPEANNSPDGYNTNVDGDIIPVVQDDDIIPVVQNEDPLYDDDADDMDQSP